MTEGLLASLVFTLWVLWTSWAVKLEQGDGPAGRTARGPPRSEPESHRSQFLLDLGHGTGPGRPCR